MIEVHGRAGALRGVAVAAEGPQAPYEIRARLGLRQGFQRSRFGSGAVSVKGAVRRVPLSVRAKAGWAADGRIRYSHERRLYALGSVNAEPLSCSAYSPSGARCGELRPIGSAPGTASELC